MNEEGGVRRHERGLSVSSVTHHKGGNLLKYLMKGLDGRMGSVILGSLVCAHANFTWKRLHTKHGFHQKKTWQKEEHTHTDTQILQYTISNDRHWDVPHLLLRIDSPNIVNVNVKMWNIKWIVWMLIESATFKTTHTLYMHTCDRTSIGFHINASSCLVTIDNLHLVSNNVIRWARPPMSACSSGTKSISTYK